MVKSILKTIFSSKTRVDILSNFYLQDSKSFFVRELARICDAQVNSIRRELENLEISGVLKSFQEKNKKYFTINKDFCFYDEFKSIFVKSRFMNSDISGKIMKTGNINFLMLTGIFIGKNNRDIDVFLVGDINKNKFEKVIESYDNNSSGIKYSILSKKNFLYRLEFRDKFVRDVLFSGGIIVYNEFKSEIEKFI